MPRSFGALLAATALALALTAPAQAAPMADLDRDGVFDDLESRVRQVSGERELRVIVRLEEDASRARVDILERRVGTLEVKDRFTAVDGFAARVAARDVRALAAAAGVAHVERDAPVRGFNSSARAGFGVTTARAAAPGLEGSTDGSAASYSPNDLVAAVIDTGIDASHADLDEGKVLAFQDFTETFFDSALDTAYDDEGHGTHVAGTIAGDGDGGPDGLGVAPGAALIGLKVLDENGDGFTSDVIAALDWTVANPGYGIDVINMSLGSDECSDGTDLETDAVDAAVAAGIVVAAAAGNAGPARCTIGSPGAAASALTVGAISDPGVGGFYMADFSSRGRTADGRVKPDVVAPGVRIRSAAANTPNGYEIASGTSMATPFVAGVVLLVREQAPALTAAQVKDVITSTALDWGRGGDQTLPGSSGLDIDHGHGRLDAHQAIAAAGAKIGAGPVVPVHRRLSSRLGGAGASETYTVRADSGGAPLAVTLTLADDDLDGDGTTEQDARGNHDVDFDMRLLDSSGNAVSVINSDGASRTAADTPWRQDAFYRAAETPRDYTLRIDSFAGSGDYLLDVSGGTIVPDGATSAPVITSPPTITGLAVPGETLTASAGTWNTTVTSTIRWLRCNASGTACSETGKTGASYAVTAADGGKWLKAIVVAASAAGEASADSGLTATMVPSVAPSVATAPSIVGPPVSGATLTVEPGTWNGTSPMTRTYSWERCNAAGADCAAIAGAAGGSYTVAAADADARLRVVESASNAAGIQTAPSAVTAQVTTTAPTTPPPTPDPEPLPESSTPSEQPPSPLGANASQPPANELPPSVIGSPRHGTLLTADEGVWRGLAPIAFGYQWQRCNSIGFDCQAIIGVTGSSYRVRGGDIERRLALRVIASNSDGSAQADSAATAVVRPARPAPKRKPTISGRPARGGLLRANGGAWWGTPRISFSATWLRCTRAGRKCKPVGRNAAYVPGLADLGRRLRVRITADNPGGRRASTSPATAVVRSVPRRRVRPRDVRRLTVRIAHEVDAAAQRRRVRVLRFG